MSNALKLALLCAVPALAACQGQARQIRAESQAVPAVATAADFANGKVVETMNSGGYTYVCIENAGRKRWAAMPPTEVAVGQEVEIGRGIEMQDFTSRTLGRTFDTITLSGGLVNDKGASAGAVPAPAPLSAALPPGHVQVPGVTPSGHPGMPPGHGAFAAHQTARRRGRVPSALAGTLVETMDAGGYTYAAVEKDGKRNWVAVPPTRLAVGQEIEFVPGFVMTNFRSKALNRTFEAITFSAGVMGPR